jgi:hypothetical protein
MFKCTSNSNTILLRTLLILTCFNTLTAANSITAGNFSELMDAINSASPGDTILMKDGTYTVNNGYGAQVRKDNIVIKSLSNNRNNVIVTGGGMSGGANYGFWIPAHNVTIQSITIQEVTNHCIQTDADNHKLRVIDCILRNGYEQLLKVPAGTGMSDSGLVEGCLFEFTKGVAENYYTGGIDCHRSKDWIVRNNVFKNIRSPGGSIAEHAIHFWNNCENITVENNLIIDCDRGIGFGMGDEKVHSGGIIRNNMIYHRAINETDFGDVGIGLEYCVDVFVYNNTIFFDNSYSNSIECRFTGSQRNQIINNLTNRQIRLRDGASATLTSNISNAESGWFVSTSAGNLHLVSGSVSSVIDQGTSLDALTTDFDSDKRPQGSGIDIGADEYKSTAVRTVQYYSTSHSPSAHFKKLLSLGQNESYRNMIAKHNNPSLKKYMLNGMEIQTSSYQLYLSIFIGEHLR